jgi:hypothetical protein
MSLSRMALPRVRWLRSAGAPGAGVALLLSLALGGCSSTGAMPNSGLLSASSVPALFAGITEPERRPVPPVEVEDDGLEAQRPPPLRMYSAPDDPTQPFSPNYGSVPPAQTPAEKEATPAPA